MRLGQPPLQGLVSAHQRAEGTARVEFAAAGLVDVYQRAPCRILFPSVDPSEPNQAVLLTTCGGLTCGDRIQVDFVAGARARATFTTQAAEKLYRATPAGMPTRIVVRLSAQAGAYAEYLAQETIIFNGAQLHRSLEADLAADACLLATESIVLGRSAMSEVLRVGFVHDSWRIRRDGRLVFADALRLDGDIETLRNAPFGFGEATAFGTLIYAAPRAAGLLELIRTSMQSHKDVLAATARDDLLIVRFLSSQAELIRNAIIATAGLIRNATHNLSLRLPQIWYC